MLHTFLGGGLGTKRMLKKAKAYKHWQLCAVMLCQLAIQQVGHYCSHVCGTFIYVGYYTDLCEKLFWLYMRDVIITTYVAHTHWQLCALILWQLATQRVLFVVSVGLGIITYT